MKPEIKRLLDRAERLYKKGLITEEQYHKQLSILSVETSINTELIKKCPPSTDADGLR